MINEKGEKILLFCDDPDCFAIHIAEKHFKSDSQSERKVTK